MAVTPVTPKQIAVTDPISPALADLEGSMIKHLRKTPELLSGIFVEVLRQFYTSENGLGLANRWAWVEKPTKGDSQVWINAESVWEDDKPDFRPAIYVSLGPLEYKSASGNPNSKISMNLEESEYHYARFASGSVVFVHVGRTLGESQQLLSNSLDLLDAFSDVIRQDFCFRTLSVTRAVSGKLMEKEPRERFRAELTMEFSFEEAWSIKLEAPKLKRVLLRALVSAADASGINLNLM